MTPFSPKDFFNLESFSHIELFEDCSYGWEALDRLQTFFQKKKLGIVEIDIPRGVFLENPALINIGKGTIIEPGAYIQGPCILGPHNVVRQGAYIRGFVVTGENCLIGHATEVKRSIFLNKAQAPHFNYVGDSILGNDTNLGAGAVLANCRFDHQEIVIHFKGEKIETKRRKLGAIVGDGVSLGCNAVSNPGTLIGPRSRCVPCLNFGGVIPADTILKENYANSSR